ncbi:MAG TPA: hypothetical protein ENN81_02605 [Phycisphaerales bacterium]|nr:hypothetical protein [Phycisphaerales bacterium]
MNFLKAFTLCVLCLVIAAAAMAQNDGQEVRPSSVVRRPSDSAVIVVVGAAGETEFGRQFALWADLWRQACDKGGVRCAVIGLDPNNGRTDRDRLKELLMQQAGADEERGTTDQLHGQDARATQGRDALATGDRRAGALWLVLIGHGTFDGRTAKFNLRGPDISAEELGRWLEPMERPVAVINTASSSAPFLTKLSGPNRVVITATKSGFEQNYARFGQYLAESIANSEADLDKDGQTSLLEAFLMAASRTAEFYAGAGRMATEHPLLDDNGDALGTRADWFRGIRPVVKAADGASLDGYRAHQFHIVRSAAEAAMTTEQRTRRDQLELEVMKLRDAKEAIAEPVYLNRLEVLLREIAELYESDPNG